MEQSVIIICVGTDPGSTEAEIEGETAQAVHQPRNREGAGSYGDAG